MVRLQLQELLELLQRGGYRTAAQLAELLGVSEKTVRTRIKELGEDLKSHGARLESKARYGYRLVIDSQAEFEAYLNHGEQTYVPETGQERNEYLLAYLLWHQDYIRIEDLGEFLYVSKTTLSASLKSVEAILRRYHLTLERRPNYGIRVAGEEFDVRHLITDYYIKRNGLTGLDPAHQQEEIEYLAKRLGERMMAYEIHLSELAFQNFVDYVYVAWKRMRYGHYLSMEKESLPEMGIKEKTFIHELMTVMREERRINYTKDEENYLLLYLAGKRMIGNVVENDSNFIIREQTDRLTLAMMDVVNQEFHIDFRSNFDLRMTLNQHLVPLDVRIRYGIPLKNPMLEEIREKYSLAYQISLEAVRVLKEQYHREISQDEIGYFALIFELALEKNRVEELSDILVVCSTGKGSSRLLKYKYEQEFSDYLRNIYVCDLLELESFDFTKVDYIFTTVPITREVPVPIVEVGIFLGHEDIQKVSSTLRRGKSDFLRKYYRPKRFLTGHFGDTKEEILKELCDIIARQEQVDDNFYDLVLERESYAQMEYGNQITMPHPNAIASEETFVYVVVLDRAVVWNRLPVRVVLLTSVGKQSDEDRQRFYDTAARFVLNKSAVDSLLARPEYDVFMKLLQENSAAE